jgi:hypothetical protein
MIFIREAALLLLAASCSLHTVTASVREHKRERERGGERKKEKLCWIAFILYHVILDWIGLIEILNPIMIVQSTNLSRTMMPLMYDAGDRD